MTTSKIIKPEGQEPDAFEKTVAQELHNLQMSTPELTADMRDLYITSAKEFEMAGAKKSIVIFVPYRLLRSFHKIQPRLIRELEKKFSGTHIVIIGQRTILGKSYTRSTKTKGVRPRSRTLTAVHEVGDESRVIPCVRFGSSSSDYIHIYV